MTNKTFYRSNGFLFDLVLLVTISCIFSFTLNAAKPANETGDLETYEKKSLFIFPVLYSGGIAADILPVHRKQFLENLLYQMFVTDFRRIDFFNVNSDDSIDAFLQDAHAFIRKNAKKITSQRMEPDGKIKEAIVTGEELLKTTENSFALVPFIDSIERKVVQGKKSTRYSYRMYFHFDIYNTKTRELLSTLRINNKKNVIGFLAKKQGSFILDYSDLAGLPENERKDEKSFRKATAGLYTVLKTKMKEMPEFRLKAVLSQIGPSTFGFDMGHDTGIKIDHRYKTYASKADGSRKMTGFGKIRTVKDTYSQAQTLIGRPQEGDQVVEDPKVGINLVGGYGAAPLIINRGGEDIVSGSHACIFMGVEYELGPPFGLSEWYSTVNLRLGLPKPEESFSYYYDSVTQIFINLGIVKKIYFRRFALNLGGYLGYHSARLVDNYHNYSGGSVGFTLNSALEVMVTPSISVYGGFNLDVYSNPAKLIDDDDNEMEFPDGWEWNAKGVSLNLGAKITF